MDAALAGSGQPLERSSRELMEARFRRDFSQVRVHADDSAAASAEALQAHFAVPESRAFAKELGQLAVAPPSIEVFTVSALAS